MAFVDSKLKRCSSHIIYKILYTSVHCDLPLAPMGTYSQTNKSCFFVVVFVSFCHIMSFITMLPFIAKIKVR